MRKPWEDDIVMLQSLSRDPCESGSQMPNTGVLGKLQLSLRGGLSEESC